MHLQSCGLESLGEEERGNPVSEWRSVLYPVTHENDSLKKVIEPGAEWLEGRISPVDPHIRYLSVQETVEHEFKVHGHNFYTLNSSVKFNQGRAHDV